MKNLFFGARDNRVNVYKTFFFADLRVHVRQPRMEGLAASNRVEGILLMPDVRPSLALIPAGSDNRALIGWLSTMPELTIKIVSSNELPLIEGWARYAQIRSDFRTSVIAREMVRHSNTAQAILIAGSEAKSASDLVGVSVKDDNERLSATTQFLHERGLITDCTVRVINAVTDRMAEMQRRKVSLSSLRNDVQAVLAAEL